MAKSLRSTPGKKQTYNLYDTSDLQRALKAINERISDIERTWGQDSQIYRDYTAPLKVLSIQEHVRIDSKGRLKLKTGKSENVEEVRTVVTKMLSKKTKGDIIESTRQQLRAGKTIKDKNFISSDLLKQLSEELKQLFSELRSLIDQIYDMGDNLREVCKELGIEYVVDDPWRTLDYNQIDTAILKLKKYIRGEDTFILGEDFNL